MNGFRRENSEIVIILEKTKKTWWKSVIVGHPEIDTTKVMFDMMRIMGLISFKKLYSEIR